MCGTCDNPESTARHNAAVAAAIATHGTLESRRVMCLTCPHRRGAVWASKGRPLGVCGAAIALTRDGVPVAGVPLGLMIAGVKACPRGRHPHSSGRVQWAWLAWLGVPEPLRWVAAALGRERGGIDATADLPGCGCIWAIKTRLTWWRRKISRAI